MITIQSLIEDNRGNVIGASTADGDVLFPEPVKRKDWEKNPSEMVEARRNLLERANGPE